MITGSRYGSIIFAASVGAEATIRWDQETKIVINGETKYFNIDLVTDTSPQYTKCWSGSSMTVDDRARLLIHELGHIFNDLLGAGGSQFVYDGPDLPADKQAKAEKANAATERKCVP